MKKEPLSNDKYFHLLENQNTEKMVELRRSTRIASSTSASKFKATKDSKVTKPKVSSTKKNAPVSNGEALDNGKEKEIEIGDEIPGITLLNQDSLPLSLKDLSTKNSIILIFAYPKASTPGCTRQACGFRDNFNELSKKALILGLSADSPVSQKKFKEKQHLQYDLLSDPNRQLIGKLGAKKSPTGIKRSHWVFKDGKLAVKRVQVSPETSVSDGKKDVLALLA